MFKMMGNKIFTILVFYAEKFCLSKLVKKTEENLTLKNFTTIVICSLICLCTLEASIANNMDPDRTLVTSA